MATDAFIILVLCLLGAALSSAVSTTTNRTNQTNTTGSYCLYDRVNSTNSTNQTTEEMYNSLMREWADNVSKSVAIIYNQTNNSDIKGTIARLTSVASCIPCNPLASKDFICPAGYSCNRNVADPSGDCIEFCCTKCQLSDYCPEGTANIIGTSNANWCANGSVCETPKTEKHCSLGSFCPVIAPFIEMKCEDLWNDGANKERTASTYDGIFCPNRSTRPKICEAGKFCPDRGGTVSLKCEKGYFCPEGVKKQRKCDFFSRCRAGSSKPGPSYRTAIFLSILLVGGLGAGIVQAIVAKVIQDQLESAQSIDMLTSMRGTSHERKMTRIMVYEKFAVRKQRTAEFAIETRLSEISRTGDEPEASSETGEEPKASSETGEKNNANEQKQDHANEQKEQHVDDDDEDKIPRFHCYKTPKMKLHAEFEDLRLTVKSRGKTITILNGVSGNIPAGSSVAIMGESGAGKTSLLNVLCGRAFYGDTTGTVLINGEVGDINSVTSMVGFVPQDDIVHETLTVYENLFFSALFRSENNASLDHTKKLVAETLKVLLLDHIRDSIVGSVEKRGISGGQRKRVNIGLEIVAEPAMIFLDEPTSGLDATSSQLIMGALKRLGEIHITSVAVIHQPRYAVFVEFDLLFLLGKGGQMVYQGAPDASEEYFADLGFEMQLNDNLADFICDVTCNAVPRKGHPDFKPSDLFHLWKLHLQTPTSQRKGISIDRKITSMGVSSDRIDRNKSFCEQIKLQFHKEGLKRWRKKITVVVEWVLCASMVLLSTIMLGTYEAKVGGNIQDLLACMLIVLLMYCLIVSYVFAKTFTVDKLIFWRESGRDYHIMAFAIANAVMDLLTLVVIASVSALIFYDFRQPWVSLGYLWLWFLVITWGFSGYAYLFSTAFPLKFSMIITVLSNTVLQVLISGTVPFLRPGIMMKQWPLPIAAVMSTGYMACDSYMVSFGNQFPIQYRVGNPGNISEFDNAAAGGIMKMTSWGYLWYSHPNDSDHAEEIFERGKYFFDPLYIILIQGAVTRALAFTLLHVMHRGAMGKPSIFSCKKIQQRRRSSAYKASTEMMVLPRVSSQDLLPTSHL